MQPQPPSVQDRDGSLSTNKRSKDEEADSKGGSVYGLGSQADSVEL